MGSAVLGNLVVGIPYNVATLQDTRVTSVQTAGTCSTTNSQVVVSGML